MLKAQLAQNSGSLHFSAPSLILPVVALSRINLAKLQPHSLPRVVPG